MYYYPTPQQEATKPGHMTPDTISRELLPTTPPWLIRYHTSSPALQDTIATAPSLPPVLSPTKPDTVMPFIMMPKLISFDAPPPWSLDCQAVPSTPLDTVAPIPTPSPVLLLLELVCSTAPPAKPPWKDRCPAPAPNP